MNLSIWNTPCSASQYQNQFQILNLHFSLLSAVDTVRHVRSVREILLRPLPPPKKQTTRLCVRAPRAFLLCINTATNFDLLVHKITIYPFSLFFFNLYSNQVWNSRSLQSICILLSTLESKMVRQKTQNQAVRLLRLIKRSRCVLVSWWCSTWWWWWGDGRSSATWKNKFLWFQP